MGGVEGPRHLQSNEHFLRRRDSFQVEARDFGSQRVDGNDFDAVRRQKCYVGIGQSMHCHGDQRPAICYRNLWNIEVQTGSNGFKRVQGVLCFEFSLPGVLKALPVGSESTELSNAKTNAKTNAFLEQCFARSP